MTNEITKQEKNKYNLVEIDDEMRIRDIDLANHLEMKNQVDIRSIIKSNIDELQSYGGLSAMAINSKSFFGGRPGTMYYLNEEQALLICILSRTAKAKTVRRDLIKIYSEYRGELLKIASDKYVIDELQHELLKSRQVWEKILKYNQKGLSSLEISRLLNKSRNFIKIEQKKIKACGYPINILKTGGQVKQQLLLNVKEV